MPVKSSISKRLVEELLEYQGKKYILDSQVNLSNEGNNLNKLSVNRVDNNNGYMTLLSEGSILYKDDTIRMYITKGTLEKFYNSIDENYEGYVTTGHLSTDSFPIRQGYFRKEDLLLVKDSNGRYDLLVKPHLNLELSSMKDLLIQDEPFAISSEFLSSEVELTDDMLDEYAKLAKYNMDLGGEPYFPIVDEVGILGFSFVANPGNAKSGGYEPSMLKRNEEERLTNKEKLDEILEKLSQKPKSSEEVTEKEDKTEITETPEVVDSEKVEEKQEDKKTDELSEVLSKATSTIEALTKENAELKAKLATYMSNEKETEERVDKLMSMLTKLGVEPVSPTVEEKEEKTNIFGRVRFEGVK